MEAADDRWPEPNRPASAAAADTEQMLLNKGSLNGNSPFIMQTLPMDTLGDQNATEATAGSPNSPNSCGTETGEESVADTQSPSNRDPAGKAADGPAPCAMDAFEAPGPWGADTGEESAADSPGPGDAETGEESVGDSPGPNDGETGEDSSADSTSTNDTRGTEEAAAVGLVPRDGESRASMVDSPGPADGDTDLCTRDLREPTAHGTSPCDFRELAENGLGPCGGDTGIEPTEDSSGPTGEVPEGRSPIPCNSNGVEEESTSVHYGHLDVAAGLTAAQELEQSPDLPYHPCAAVEMETDVPGVGGPSVAFPSLWGTTEDLPTDSSNLLLSDRQVAVAHFTEATGGLEPAAGEALANSNDTEYADGLAHYQPGGAGDYEAVESDDGVPPYPADFEKYWKIVEDNPYDFTGWTYVLQYVEQENHIWAVRRAFDSFFTRYPYCYGYWKKYADIEKRLGFTKEAEEVYQRGLQSIPLSVDLWIHYIAFLQEVLEPTSPDTSVKLRSVFEMALAAAGTDFRSDRLWDLYVSWEKEQGQLKAVTAIYDRLLSIPTQLYSHHFEKFKEHVQSYSPKDILSTDEFLRLRSEVVTSLAATEADSDEGPPGDDPPPGVGSTDQEKADTELEKIRAHLEATRHEMYLLNEEEVSKRWHFEEAIKRPYFHVKPLERVQLKNWKDYLDFEIASGTNERVLVLFERCVIACALYEDFWIKYAKYLENHSVEAVRNVFQRACMVHLPKKPTLHLLWAAFEEQQGELKEARRILKSFQMVMPGLAMVLLRRVSLERRCGNLDQAEALLREAIEQHQDTPLASFFAIKLSRQLLKVQRNLTKARKVLLEAIDRDKDNVKLYLNLLELEFSCDVRANESNILGCFDQVLSSSLPLEIKIVFSQRRVEFLEDFGCSVRSLLHAYDEHQKLLKQNSSKKRAAENGMEEPDEKKARAEDGVAVIASTTAVTTTSTAALVSGDASGGQAAYNYSAWYQPYGSYGYQNPWNYSQYYPHS
ncbi:pre-mRNA-processing factor 39-like [Pristis pectinata]|uniref:pre-mRNA-processing factor 39-like n=1 Tax=Pristis pectinata TaxID=685728 RepID=UPI00223E4A09|nr:pre-mRNA-processing factor 39-like [Pristis pectinata]